MAESPISGRRPALLIVDAAIYAIGVIASALAVNSFMLLASRTIIGLAGGADWRLPFPFSGTTTRLYLVAELLPCERGVHTAEAAPERGRRGPASGRGG
jgi:MFS family permease